MQPLENFFHNNQWCDLANLEELQNYIGLNGLTAEVIHVFIKSS